MPEFTHRPEYRMLVDALKDARLKAGLTQADLGAALGVAQTFVSKVERGERRVDVVEFVDICRALGADPLKVMRAVLL